MSRLLELAKVQLQLLSAIENLTKHWTTIVSLHGINKSVITDIIKYIEMAFFKVILCQFYYCVMFKPSVVFITKRERLFIWEK